MEKQAFVNKNGKLNMNLKKRIVKYTARSVALYGTETWTVFQTDRDR